MIVLFMYDGMPAPGSREAPPIFTTGFFWREKDIYHKAVFPGPLWG